MWKVKGLLGFALIDASESTPLATLRRCPIRRTTGGTDRPGSPA